MSETLKLYHSTGSPNSRRVRIFVAEKVIDLTLMPVDLGKGEQHSDAYRAINPRRMVPTLILPDGSSIAEVPAIFRYLEAAYPEHALLGATPKEKALVIMWERRVELDGFAAVMEAVRNTVAGLKGRALAGPHDYDQIPELAERSRKRVVNFYIDLETRLTTSPHVALDRFSAADITALVTIDFATRALSLPIPETAPSVRRWYDLVAARPSSAA